MTTEQPTIQDFSALYHSLAADERAMLVDYLQECALKPVRAFSKQLADAGPRLDVLDPRWTTNSYFLNYNRIFVIELYKHGAEEWRWIVKFRHRNGTVEDRGAAYPNPESAGADAIAWIERELLAND
jgi:hypothetical protein